MRILQVLLSERIGGAESAASSLASEWRAKGHDSVTVYLDSKGNRAFSRVRYLFEEIRALKPDVVVSHSALPNLYTRAAAIGLGVPVVCVLHSAARDFDDVKIRVSERLLRFATAAVVAVSASQVSEYRSHFPRARVDLIPNGVEGKFSPASEMPPGFRILSVGRVVHQKDPDTWSQIARAMYAKDERLRFVWIGPTGLDSDLSSLENVLKGSVEAQFAGPSSDVATELRQSRFLLHTAHREAHSVALLEAAASGLPIVCTREVGAGLPNWVVREEFVAGDVASGVRAVSHVVSEIEVYEGLARAAAAKVVREFGVGACADRYLQVFSRMV